MSYNINSISRGFMKGFASQMYDYDIVLLQETKCNPEAVFEIPGFHSYYHCSEAKRGYSGVSVHTKIKPKKVTIKFDPEMDDEGRFIMVEFENIQIINVYTPNAKDDCSRMDYQMEFGYRINEKFFRDPTKKILYAGDINLAHQPGIDVGSLIGKPWWRNPINGTRPEQVQGLDILESDYHFVDLYRWKHPGDNYRRSTKYRGPDNAKDMSWFSSQTFAKCRGLGWRVDYLFASWGLFQEIKDLDYAIVNEQMFPYSDHVPITLYLPSDLFCSER
jgi:exodeoxyribonuclease-3